MQKGEGIQFDNYNKTEKDKMFQDQLKMFLNKFALIARWFIQNLLLHI